MARETETPHDLGKPIEFDPDFKGPLKRRSCTDVICLFLFIIFIGCWIGVGLYAYLNGDPQMLLVPRDSEGSRCGVDYHVKDKPYLFFFDLTKCLNPNVAFTGCKTPQVCLERCPQDDFVFRSCNSNKKIKLICVDGERTLSCNEAETEIENNRCARYHIQSTSVLNRCLYNIADRRLLRVGIADRSVVDIAAMKKSLELSNTWLSLIVHSAIGFFTEKEGPHQVGHDIVEDIKTSWPEIAGGFAVAIIVCILYIAVMRWIAPVMVWLSIFGAIAILGFCCYICGNNYSYYKSHPYDQEYAKSVFQKYLKTQEFWLVLLIIVSVVLGILLFVLIFLRKRIVLAIALIKEGSKAVSAATSTLFFPIVPWILQMAIVAYAIGIALYLSTVGSPLYEIRNIEQSSCSELKNYKNGDVCSMETFATLCPKGSISPCKFIRMNNPPIIPYVHVFNVFGFFWGVFFISALGEMILAATFATWYWTFNKSKVPFFTLTAATGRTLRYHIGTLAFGSLIIAICRMIRVCLEYIDHKLKTYDNEITKAILCCLKCFFWCLEKFLKFINKNAYIMCAIHGKNFCSSAKDAFSLLLRNIVRVFVLDKVTDFLFFLSKLLITIGVGCIVYSFLEFISHKELNYIIVPVVFVAICTYFITSVFFSVYTMAVDTLFLCFLEDCERNDGSASKPYFMSKNLMKILGKKNKMS